MGKEDLGRDLICTKGKQVLIIQAKNWSKHKTIHKNHLMQLAGTILYYIYKNKKHPKGLFITTTKVRKQCLFRSTTRNKEYEK